MRYSNLQSIFWPPSCVKRAARRRTVYNPCPARAASDDFTNAISGAKRRRFHLDRSRRFWALLADNREAAAIKAAVFVSMRRRRSRRWHFRVPGAASIDAGIRLKRNRNNHRSVNIIK